MAYMVRYRKTVGWDVTYFYQYKIHALERFNQIMKENNLPTRAVGVPYWITLDDWHVSVTKIDRWDNIDKKSVFIDDEWNWLIVLWDMATFWAEYVRLSKKYEKNEREWSDFYEELQKNLRGKGTEIIVDIPRYYEKDLDRS